MAEETLLGRAARPVIGGLEAVGNLLDLPASMGRDVLSFNNPFDQLLTPFSSRNRLEGRDVLRKYGLVGKEDTWQNWGAGLGFEILTDPLTYMTFGASAGSKAIKPAGKALQNAGYFDEAMKLSGKGPREFRAMSVGDALDLVKSRHSVNPGMKDAIDSIYDVSAKTMGLDPVAARRDKIGDLVGLHVPFTKKTAGWTPKEGSAAHNILVKGRDKIGKTVSESPPITHARALFSRAAMRQTDAGAQNLAREITEAKDTATTVARMRVAPTAEKLYERGFMQDPKNAVEESQAMWLLLEGHDLDAMAKNAPATAKMAETARAMQEKYGDVVDELKQHARRMGEIGSQYGIEPEALMDNFIKSYFPRQRNRIVRFWANKARNLGPEEKLADTRMPQSWARDPWLMNIRGGTAALNQMSVDPRISGIAHRMGGYATDGKIPAQDIERVSNILKSEWGLEAVTNPKEGQDPEEHIKKLAKWLMELDPRHAQEPSKKLYNPAFKVDPIENLMDTYENAYRASAAAELTFEQILARADVTEQMAPDWVNLKEVMDGMHMGTGRNKGNPVKMLAATLRDRPEFADRLGPSKADIMESIEGFLDGKNPPERFLEKLSVPPEVAGPLIKYMKSFTEPEELKGFLRVFDAATALYKGSLTTMWPAFHGRNVMSAMFQNYVGGAYDPTAPRHMRYMKPYLDAADILSGKKPDELLREGMTYKQARNYMWASGLTQPAATSEALEGVADMGMRTSVPSNVVGDKGFMQQAKNVWAHFQDGVSDIKDMNPLKRKDIDIVEKVRIYEKLFGPVYEDGDTLRAMMGTADISGNPATDWGVTRYEGPRLKKIKRIDIDDRPRVEAPAPKTAEDLAGAPPQVDEFEPFKFLSDKDGSTTWVDSPGQPFRMKFTQDEGGLTVRLEGITGSEAKIAKRGPGGRGFARFADAEDLQRAISDNEGVSFPLPVNKAKGDYYISPREADAINTKVQGKYSVAKGKIPPKDASNDEIRTFFKSYEKNFRKEASNYRGWGDASDEVKDSIVTQAMSDFAYRTYGPHVQTQSTKKAIRDQGLAAAEARKAYQEKLKAANEELARGQAISQEGLIGHESFDPMEMSWSQVKRTVHDPDRPRSGNFYIQYRGNKPIEFKSYDAAIKSMRKLAKEEGFRLNWKDQTPLKDYNYGQFGTYGPDEAIRVYRGDRGITKDAGQEAIERVPAWKGGDQRLAPLSSGEAAQAVEQLAELPRVAPDRVLSHIGRRMFGDDFTGDVAIGLNKSGEKVAVVMLSDEAIEKYVTRQVNLASDAKQRSRIASEFGDSGYDGNGLYMFNKPTHNMRKARQAIGEDFLRNSEEMATELKDWSGVKNVTSRFVPLDKDAIADDIVGEIVEVEGKFSPMKVIRATDDGKIEVAVPDSSGGVDSIVDMKDVKSVRQDALGSTSTFPKILQEYFEEGANDSEFLDYLRGIDPALGSENTRVGYQQSKIATGKKRGRVFYERLAAKLDDESLKKMKRSEIRHLAKKMGIGTIRKKVGDLIPMMRDAQKKARGINDKISDRFDQIAREAIDQFEASDFAASGKNVVGQKEIGEVWKGATKDVTTGTKRETKKEAAARAWSTFVNSAFNPVNQSGVFAQEGKFIGERAGRAAAEYSEEMVRGAAFVAFIKQGMSAKAAAQRAKDMHVDYGNLSQFEKRVMKRVFPFYSFTRGITPWVVDKLASEPGGELAQTIRATRLAKDRDREMPDHVAGTTAIPVTDTPLEYIFGPSKDGGMKYLTGLGLMHEAPADFLGGSSGAEYTGVSPRNFMLQAASMSHPVIKAPLEWMTNQTFFQRGPEGGRSLDDLDPLVGRTVTNIGDSITGARTREADMLPKGVEFALSNSPISRALTTTRKIADPRRSIFDKALNTLTGFQTYNVNEAAEDAILREKISQQMRQMGAAEFTNTYFPDETLKRMSPAQQERAQRHLAIMQELRERAKKRKEEREARKQKANAG